MLYYNTVEPATLSLLKELQSLPYLSHFSLVGGTALSLQYGHRISVDLDLFSVENFDVLETIKKLEKHFKTDFFFESTKNIHFGIFCFIRNVKVDIVRYPHPQIDDNILIDGIKMYSMHEIAAMKIQAILGRGKKKDFWDLAELLKHLSLSEIIDSHKKKFPSQMLAIGVLDAIIYFADAEEGEDPICLREKSWKMVKSEIQKAVRDYLA